MFKFEDIFYLYLLLAIPILLVLFYLANIWRKNQIARIGDPTVVSRLFPEWSSKKVWLKNFLILCGLSLLFISAANPQWGAREQKVTAKSSDIIIALDISQSMMATDISPSRMERAKRFTEQLIRSLKGERIGLIYFAGGAYLQMPLTQDYAAAELFIKSANTQQAGSQGTAIADAIDLSQNVFNMEKAYQKALVIISDGENHDSEAIAVAKKVAENGTYIFTIGVGTQEGAMVPFEENGRTVYKKDKNGDPVSSKLNVALMQDIADAANGNFYLMDDSFSLRNKIKSDLDNIEKIEVEQRSFTDYASYFQYFLFFAIIFIFIEFFVSNRKSSSLNIRKWLNI